MGLTSSEYKVSAERVRVEVIKLNNELSSVRQRRYEILGVIEELRKEMSREECEEKGELADRIDYYVMLDRELRTQIANINVKISEAMQRVQRMGKDIVFSINNKSNNITNLQNNVLGRYSLSKNDLINKNQQSIRELNQALSILSTIDGFNGSSNEKYMGMHGNSISDNSVMSSEKNRGQNFTGYGVFNGLNQSNYNSTKVSVISNNNKNGSKDISIQEANQYSANGYAYKTDALGRIISASGTLSITTNPIRDSKAQQSVGGKDRFLIDSAGNIIPSDGGHLIAAMFGGAPGFENLVAMDRYINRGPYRKLEMSWKKAIENGNTVYVEVNPFWGGKNNSDRCTALIVNYTVTMKDGTQYTEHFSITNDDVRAAEYQYVDDTGDSSFKYLDDDQSNALNEILTKEAKNQPNNDRDIGNKDTSDNKASGNNNTNNNLSNQTSSNDGSNNNNDNTGNNNQSGNDEE